MEKWEYRTEIIRAGIDSEGVREKLAKKYPGWEPSKFSPETMEIYLDEQGNNGWELVSMQPIAGVGENRDILHSGYSNPYSNAYFCAFKRRKQE